MPKTKYCFQSSWTFRKFSEALDVYSNRNCYVRNHVSKKAKGKLSNGDRIHENGDSSQEVKLQAKFPAKKHPPTVDTDKQTFNRHNVDGHSQTGKQANISATKIRKQQEVP